jgi:putative transposase
MKKNRKQLEIFEPRPLLRVDVSIPAVRETLQLFAANRVQAWERFSTVVREAVADGVNQLLDAEITLFLGRADQVENKRNGYQIRKYQFKGIGGLQLLIPRDRHGEFNSVVIPTGERGDPRLRQDMALLHLAGISNRTMAMISRRILGVGVSKDTVSRSLSVVHEHALKWLTRPLTERYWALYIDGTNFKIQRRGSTAREPSLVVLGVNESNYRSILSVEPGSRDNVDSWRSVFRELKRRGLPADGVRLGIMDGLPGLENLFCEEFPSAGTQRCWLHAKRNALAKSPARFRDAFGVLLEKVMYARSDIDGRVAFEALKSAMGKDAQRAVACIEKDLDALLYHHRFEERFWPALKTTNPVERLNKEFKRRTKSMETLGENTLMAVVAFTALRLELGWHRTPIDSQAMWNLKGMKDRKALAAKDAEQAFQKMSEELH